MTNEVNSTKDFYTKYFAFHVTFDADWYVSLKHETNDYELAVLNQAHQTVPNPFRQTAQGLILNFEVEDVDSLYEKLIVQEKLPLQLDLRDEAFGQRHFMTRDPNGVLIDVIKIIPPDSSFLEQYKEEVWEE